MKMLTLWILLTSLLCASAQDKPPLTIDVIRSWSVPDNYCIGAKVTTVSTRQKDGTIVYGLEHNTLYTPGFSSISDPEPLPFSINPETGVVRTNQSVANWAGKTIILYVTAKYNDSEITSKNQVMAKFLKTKPQKNCNPGNEDLPDPQQNFLPPRPEDEIPTKQLLPKKPSTKLNNVNGTTSSSTSPKPAVKSTTTSNVADSSHADLQPTRTKSEEGEESSISSTKSTMANNSKTVETELIASHEPSGGKLIFVCIAVILIFTSLLVSVIACMFRKKIFKRKNKIKKDDMKKSSCSVLSLEESMVLHHWRGARGLSNRCDSWDSESHNQSTLALNTVGKTADKWEIPRHHIKVFNILGEGCFGQVWKCEALNIDSKEGPTVVAVKMLKENAGEQERSDLAQELQVMKMLDPHPNVVRLLGCCTEKEPIFVIMEFVPNGKLQSYLRHSRAQRYYDNMHGSSNTLTSRDLTAFCYQVAKGMQYLSSKGIIHRDLAARNILVGDNHTCKVADFGFARDIMTSHVYERKSEGRLPIRWMAPESLYYNVFSVKSDIWSFGVLVWEIVTLGSTPYPGIPAAKVMSKVRDGYRLEKPEHCRRELYNIMYYCWDKDPNERPTFAELVDLLEQLLLTETDYILLERFPDHSYYNMVSLSGEKL